MGKNLRENVIQCLQNWSRERDKRLFTNFWIFGSLVKGEGDQFIRETSDVDLVILLNDSLEDALSRASSCRGLLDAKLDLEVELMKILRRGDASKPIVSLVLLTRIELTWDIHKSKKLRFFRDNLNSSFCLSSEGDGFPKIDGITNREDEKLLAAIQALEETQEYRNKYLAISPNGSPKVEDYASSSEVFPKELARCSAQVFWALKNSSDKFDTPNGTKYLTRLLDDKAEKDADEAWKSLSEKVHRRTYPKQYAEVPALDGFDLLLLYELLFDQAYTLASQIVNLPPSPEPPIITGDFSSQDTCSSFFQVGKVLHWEVRNYGKPSNVGTLEITSVNSTLGKWKGIQIAENDPKSKKVTLTGTFNDSTMELYNAAWQETWLGKCSGGKIEGSIKGEHESYSGLQLTFEIY